MTWRPPRISPSRSVREAPVTSRLRPWMPRLPPVQGRSTRRQSRIVVRAAEQAELRRVARRLGEAEMAEGVRGQEPPARRALDEAFLDQERLDDFLDGITRLR